MTKVLVDQGNSRTKLLLCSTGRQSEVIDSGQLVSSDNSHLEQLREPLDNYCNGTSDSQLFEVTGISVAPDEQREELTAFLAGYFQQPARWLQSRQSAQIADTSLYNAYSKPDALGVDRWAAMAGSVVKYPCRDIIIADFGTATTVDVLRADGQHLGGWIVPGLKTTDSLMQQRLSKLYTPHFTASRMPNESAEWLGKSTPAAIQTGLVQMQLGLLDRAVRLSEAAGLVSSIVLITGGEAQILLSSITCDYQHQPMLVFYGINALAST